MSEECPHKHFALLRLLQTAFVGVWVCCYYCDGKQLTLNCYTLAALRFVEIRVSVKEKKCRNPIRMDNKRLDRLVGRVREWVARKAGKLFPPSTRLLSKPSAWATRTFADLPVGWLGDWGAVEGWPVVVRFRPCIRRYSVWWFSHLVCLFRKGLVVHSLSYLCTELPA